MELLQLILTATLSVAALFLIAKVMGHKEIAQLDFFDYISGITIGSIGAELATELETPWKPLVAMIVYGAVALGLDILTNKLPRTRKYVNGSPTILMDSGKIYRDNLKKAKLNLTEFMMMCRQAGYFNLSDIQTAVLEYNGKLSVLPVSSKRPANPADLELAPPQESINTEIIMDGRVLEGNLKRKGLDTKWLQKQLKAQGYHDAKEIFLGVCDENNALSLYKSISARNNSTRSD